MLPEKHPALNGELLISWVLFLFGAEKQKTERFCPHDFAHTMRDFLGRNF
jgi:hypothetical protein